MPRLRAGHERGFTLVELVVVVAILAILAIVSIPVYRDVQATAEDSAVKSDLSNARSAVATYWAKEGPDAPVPTFDDDEATGLRRYGYTRSEQLTIKVVFGTADPAADSFCLEAWGTSARVFHSWGTSSVEPAGC